jgi:hypothetical protein
MHYGCHIMNIDELNVNASTADHGVYDSAATRYFVGSLTGKERFLRLRLVRISSEPVYRVCTLWFCALRFRDFEAR